MFIPLRKQEDYKPIVLLKENNALKAAYNNAYYYLHKKFVE